MKIVVITASYPPYHKGGYELRCQDVLNELVKKGHELFVLSEKVEHEPRNAQQTDNPQIYRILNLRNSKDSILQQVIRDYVDIRKIENILTKIKPDMIYFWHMAPLSNAIFPYLSQKGYPMIFDEGGSGLIHLYKIYNRWIYFYKEKNGDPIKQWIKGFFMRVVSRLSGNRICNQWEWPNKMSIYYNSMSSLNYAKTSIPGLTAEVIHSGIHIEKFVFDPSKKSNGRIKIILPGRITPIKGTIDGVDLLNDLRGHGIDAELLIVGFVDSEEYLNAIKERAVNLKVSEFIYFLPMQKHVDMVKLYQEFDFCFFPSYQEIGFSRVPLEAMACGCLVISYGNEGSSEIIQDGFNGYIISPRNFERCIAIMNNCLSSEKYRNILFQARECVEKEYSFQKYIDRITQLLQKTVESQ